MQTSTNLRPKNKTFTSLISVYKCINHWFLLHIC
uniref:Uncharacterized protein n=1 Tax=Arundo donax TaxID=35708 RepID=A0A0A8Z420_ARUDO